MQVLKNHHLDEPVPNLPIIVNTPNFPYFSNFWFYLRPFACTHVVNCDIFYRKSMTTPVACFVWNRKWWESSAPINSKPFSFTFYNVTRKKHLKLDILSNVSASFTVPLWEIYLWKKRSICHENQKICQEKNVSQGKSFKTEWAQCFLILLNIRWTFIIWSKSPDSFGSLPNYSQFSRPSESREVLPNF